MNSLKEGCYAHRHLLEVRDDLWKRGVLCYFDTETVALQFRWSGEFSDDSILWPSVYVINPPDSLLHLFLGWLLFSVPASVLADALQEIKPEAESVCVLLRELDAIKAEQVHKEQQ